MENRAYLENLTTSEEESLAGELREQMNRLCKSGKTNQSRIADDLTGKMSRTTVNQFLNGVKKLKADKLEILQEWLDEFTARQDGRDMTVPAAIPALELKREVGYFSTLSHATVMGQIKMLFNSSDMWIGALIGDPGTGKTTLARKIQAAFPKTLYIEAFPCMRMGDLLKKIAQGLGISLSGTLYNRVEEIMAALDGRGYSILVDETEYLRKWDTEKLDQLRKICEDTRTNLVYIGTQDAKRIIDKMGQLSSRAKKIPMAGVKAEEVQEELAHYDMEPQAAELLARAVENTKRGGLRKYHNTLHFALHMAEGRRITEGIMRDALDFCDF